MVELRWKNIYSKIVFKDKKTLLKTVLEYRQYDTYINKWSEWKEVPTVDEDDRDK